MKIKYTLPIIALIISILSGCSEDPDLLDQSIPLAQIVKVDVKKSGVTFTGSVLNVGTDPVLSYGFVWSEGEYPSIYDHILTCKEPFSKSDFSKTEYSDIEFKGTYYVRTFIKSKSRVIYGNSLIFQGKSTFLPVIEKVSPTEVSDGDIVTITGKGFSSKANLNRLTLNGMTVTLIKSSSDSLTFKVPTNNITGPANLIVNIGGNKLSKPQPINIIGPVLETISKTSGYSGDTITITGKNLQNYDTNTLIYFEEKLPPSITSYKAEIISITDNQIVLRVPIPIVYYNLRLEDFDMTISFYNGGKMARLNQVFTLKNSWKRFSLCPANLLYQIGQGFTYNNKGYIYDFNKQCFYIYNQNDNSWSQKITTPGRITENGIYIVDGDRLLILGGDQVLNKVWEYNFLSETWKSQGDMPFNYSYATFFRNNRKVYILTSSNSFWCYDLDKNTFEHLNDAPLGGEYWENANRYASSTNSYAFIFSQSKTVRFDFTSMSWETLKSNPLGSYQYGKNISGFVLNNRMYIIDNNSTMYQYNYQNDTWALLSKIPWSPYNSTYITNFVIDNRAYIFSFNGIQSDECAYYYDAK